MTCDKCEHFKIMYEPQRSRGVIWDLGRAHCKKHNLIVDFANHGKFKRLKCPDKVVVEGGGGMKTNGDIVRAMTDEELVGFIFSPCTRWSEKCQETGCHDCLLKWLKEEVE